MGAHVRLELSILTGEDLFTEEGDIQYKKVAQNFIGGKYDDVLKNSLAQNLFCGNLADRTPAGLENLIRRNVEELLADDNHNRAIEVLIVGVAFLQLFVQNNWTGPLTSVHPWKLIPGPLFTDNEVKSFAKSITMEMCVDGEPLYELCHYVEFLYLSRCILLGCNSLLKNLQTADWWLMRCLSIHQQVLDEKSPTLKKRIYELIENLSEKSILADGQNRKLNIEFHVEIGHLYIQYYQFRKAKEHFNKASDLAGLGIELTGALGKRTRFQETDIAQLHLDVTRTSDKKLASMSSHIVKSTGLTSSLVMYPKNIQLDDDTTLDTVKFKDSDEVAEQDLTPLEQTVILGLMEDRHRSQPNQEKLTTEELMAYILYLLAQPKSWCVQMAALFLRSTLEKSSGRRIERSMMQIEELVKQLNQVEPSQRLQLFYSVHIPPVWLLKRQLAILFMSVGAIGAACEVFEQIELWEDVILCYQKMGKLEKAETIIRERLEQNETASLYCFLGDVTRNISYYERAWELSKHRSARAQRNIGYIYFGRQDWDSCLTCFERSLKINALQIPLWFTNGCAAMAAGRYDLAASSFNRCVMIDYDNFEAWSNLAAAYVKLNQKKKAFAVLQDAIKCSYDNWKLWENYLIVGVDCGQFKEVIRASHRLLDLKEKWIDEEILSILVRAITEDIPDANSSPSSALHSKALELFGRITSKTTSNATIWKLYADLVSHGTNGDTAQQEKALHFLQKSYRCIIQMPGWEKDIKKCEEIGQQSLELAEMYLKCSENAASSATSVQLLSSAKFMLRSLLATVEKQYNVDPPVTTSNVSPAVKSLCDRIASMLQQIISHLARAQT